MSEVIPPLFVATWSALFLAALICVWSDARHLGLTLLLAACAGALASALVTPVAALSVAALLAAAWAVRRPQRAWQCSGHALFIVVALALNLHWLPGFHNPLVIDAVRLTVDAVPFSMYLNVDKPLAAFWVVLCLPWIHLQPDDLRRALHRLHTLKTAGLCALFTSALCLGLACLLGLVSWAPKLPSQTWLWLLNNLLLVCFAEEALFRAYLQGGIRRLLGPGWRADALAIGIAALLFGLAHVAGGWRMAMVAAVAGVGYGLAYRWGGLRAAVLTHAILNTTHFLLFTYPLLQPPG